MKTTNILFCGVGGQGIITASEVCAWAAIYAGQHVKKSEVHGMSQRGGSVESSVRFGEEVFSPLIPAGQVNYLVPLNVEEHARFKNILTNASVDLISYLQKGQAQIANVFLLNTYMLGVLSAKLAFSEEHWLKALTKVIPEKVLAENIKVFQAGREA